MDLHQYYCRGGLTGALDSGVPTGSLVAGNADVPHVFFDHLFTPANGPTQVHPFAYWNVDGQTQWKWKDLSYSSGEPAQSLTVKGAVSVNDYGVGVVPDVRHVFCINQTDSHVHVLFAGPNDSAWKWSDLTATTGVSAVNLVAYTTLSRQIKHALCQGADGRIRELRSMSGESSWRVIDVTSQAGAPLSDGWFTALAVATNGVGDQLACDDERNRIADQHPNRLVMYFHGGLVPSDSADSSGKFQLVPATPWSNGIDRFIMATQSWGCQLDHEAGHYLHLGHTFGRYCSNATDLADPLREAAAKGWTTKDNAAAICDGDVSTVQDTPPDPGYQVAQYPLVVPVVFPDGSQKTYSFSPHL